MEACGGAHHWGREIGRLGHEVKLIAPAYVKPFVRRQKNDMADAEAICEAAQRPTMRFVPVKSELAQASALVFRTRDLLVRQRTQLINALRGHMTEFGMVVAQGPMHVGRLIAIVEDPVSNLLEPARIVLGVIIAELRALNERVSVLDAEIVWRAKQDPVARRLITIPGIGAITATALVALAPSAATFRRGHAASRCGGPLLCQLATVPGRHGSLQWCALLDKSAHRVRSPSAVDQPAVRETVRENKQERPKRRGSHM
jgi:transposase